MTDPVWCGRFAKAHCPFGWNIIVSFFNTFIYFFYRIQSQNYLFIGYPLVCIKISLLAKLNCINSLVGDSTLEIYSKPYYFIDSICLHLDHTYPCSIIHICLVYQAFGNVVGDYFRNFKTISLSLILLFLYILKLEFSA